MLVTFKSGLQITASLVELDAIGLDSDDFKVFIYFNGIQDIR